MNKTFRVRAKTNQRKESVSVDGDIIEISVKAKPELGAANERIVALIAARFHVPLKKVRITKGLRSPSKYVSISVV